LARGFFRSGSRSDHPVSLILARVDPDGTHLHGEIGGGDDKIVAEFVDEPLRLTVTAAAKALGVSRQALNNLVHGQARISPEMAIRLDKAFGGGTETWLRLQVAYDLAQLGKESDKIKVRRTGVRKEKQLAKSQRH